MHPRRPGGATDPATACPIVAVSVDGHDNIVGIDASGCGYTSLDLVGHYTIADILNMFGNVVSGIYDAHGNALYIRNVGDNQIGNYVVGSHDTSIEVEGDGNQILNTQTGAPSSSDIHVQGDGVVVSVSIR